MARCLVKHRDNFSFIFYLTQVHQTVIYVHTRDSAFFSFQTGGSDTQVRERAEWVSFGVSPPYSLIVSLKLRRLCRGKSKCQAQHNTSCHRTRVPCDNKSKQIWIGRGTWIATGLLKGEQGDLYGLDSIQLLICVNVMTYDCKLLGAYSYDLGGRTETDRMWW